MVEQRLEENGGSGGVDAHVLLDLVHARPVSDNRRKVNDGVDSVESLLELVRIADIPDENLRSPVEVLGQAPLRPVHLRHQVVEDTDLVTVLQQFSREVRPDESRSPGDENGLTGIRMHGVSGIPDALFALNIIANTKY